MIRLSREEYVCYLALAASSRSEDEFTKTGAALLDINGNVLGTGVNGLKAGMDVPDWMKLEENRGKKSDLYLHSETNLWQRKKEGEEYLLGITMSPCKSCAQMISASKVKKVVFIRDYERGTKDYKDIFDFYGIEYRLLSFGELSRIQKVMNEDMHMIIKQMESIDEFTR